MDGLFQAVKLIGRPKAGIIDFLLFRGTALGLKRPMAQGARKVRAGLGQLRMAGLYPYDVPDDSERALSSGTAALPFDKPFGS